MTLTRRHLVASALLAPFSARAEDDGFVMLEAREASLPLSPAPALETPVWGFNGLVPGPLLRIKKGAELKVRLVNKLAQPTSLHFQGVRGPNAMDGVAGLTQAAVAPGASFDYRFTPADAGTFCYRPGVAEVAAEQNARGLYGLLVVDEAEPPAVDLDLPLVIADWRLDAKGGISGPFPDPTAAAGAGRVGDLVTVNSAAMPLVVPLRPGARARLRFHNACGSQLMALMFRDIRAFVIAVDGQPCDPFEPLHSTLPLAPGTRFDIIVDIFPRGTPGPAVVLRGGGLRGDPQESDRDLVAFHATDEAPLEPRPVFPGLTLNPLLPPEIHLEKAKRLDIVIEGPGKIFPRLWSLNGGAGAVGGKPLFSVKKGEPVTLGFVNRTPVVQCLRVHGHVMRVLHLLDDGWEPYWRDTVTVAPGKTSRVAFIADNPGKWLVESAIFDHAAAGARAWFEVA